jgi:hypothetical protein
MKSAIYVRLLQMVERLMSRLESDQSEPIWLIVNWRKSNSAFLQLFPVQVLETHLNKLHCILLLDFTEIEND